MVSQKINNIKKPKKHNLVISNYMQQLNYIGNSKKFPIFSEAELAQKQGLIGHAMLSLGRTSSLTSIILIESKKIILKTSYTGPLSHAYALLMSNLIPTLDLLISSYELLLKIALHNSRSIQSRR